MSVLNTGLATPSRGYDIDQSLRFNEDDSAYLNKTWGSSPTDGNKFTFSVWVKRGDLDSGTTQFWLLGAKDSAESNIKFYEDKIEAHLTGSNYDFKTDAVFRDTSAWYHLVFTYDSDDGTVADRFKIYVNGVRQALGTTSTIPSGTANEFTKNGTGLHLGAHASNYHHFDGHMAEAHLIDGSALTPSSFGRTGTYGEWKPIEVSGLTYGTNGFYLDFADSGNLGDDVSGNGNDCSANNLSASDQMLDTPTNNFATLNPLKDFGAGPPSNATFSEVNLSVTGSATGSSSLPLSTFSIPTDTPVYFEVVFTNQDCSYGIASDTSDSGNGGIIGTDTDGLGWGAYVGASASWRGFFNGGTRTAHNFSGGGVYQMAVDLANNKIWFGKDGVWYNSGNPATGANATYTNVSTTRDLFVSLFGNAGVANFGQDSSFAGNKTAQGNQDGNEIGDFYYTPPSGFLALCTSNLPEPAVKPSQHFNTITYSGDSTNRTLTGVGFQPDFSWIKSRSNGTNGSDHWLFDAVRGVNAFTGLCSNGNSVEGEAEAGSLQVNFGDISAFTSDGYSVYRSTADPSHQYEGVNNSGETYVAWNWKANGSGSANTNGSTNSTVSANTDAGFSIVSYTGTGSNATVGHGLSVAPEMVIVKSRSSVESWICYTEATGNTGYLPLNATSAFSSSSTMFNNTSPTASLFTVGTNNATNSNTQTYIAYCFHSVDDYSKVGSYVGNGSTDGTFIYTGFRPAYVMWKETSAGTHGWMIHDNARSTYNPSSNYLRAESAAAEGSYPFADFTSNGFKQRHTSTWANGNGVNYIYIAFAEIPFKYSNAR